MIGQPVRQALLVIGMGAVVACSLAGQSAAPGRWGGPGWPPRDRNPQFFPAGLFGKEHDAIAGMSSWYLRCTGERPLADYIGPHRSQVYRALTYARPSHTWPYWTPVVVRLSVGPTGSGEVVVTVAHDDHHPASILVSRRISVSRTAVTKFVNLLDESGFWTMPAEKPLDTKHLYLGAVDWLFEGEKAGHYQAVDRSPLEPGHLRDAELFLVTNLAGLDLKSIAKGSGPGR